MLASSSTTQDNSLDRVSNYSNGKQWVVANIYGFYWEDGTRRFSTAYIEIARKNGKTQLAAAIALYALVGEGESAAQVIAAANSKD